MQQGEDGWDKNKSGERSSREPADDGTAKRRILLAAFTQAKRHGNHADDHRQGRHHDGAKACAAGFNCRKEGIMMLFKPSLCERDDEDRICGGDAHAHDGAHQCRHAERGVGSEQKQHNASQRGGQRGDDDEGVKPGLEVDHDEQIHQHNRKAEPADEADIGGVHRLNLALH